MIPNNNKNYNNIICKHQRLVCACVPGYNIIHSHIGILYSAMTVVRFSKNVSDLHVWLYSYPNNSNFFFVHESEGFEVKSN
jgi:hypothetical protein